MLTDFQSCGSLETCFDLRSATGTISNACSTVMSVICIKRTTNGCLAHKYKADGAAKEKGHRVGIADRSPIHDSTPCARLEQGKAILDTCVFPFGF